MNAAYAHIALNHLPIVGFPIVLVFLVYALIRRNEGARRFALGVLIFVVVMGALVYFTGEPAEEVLEKFQSVSEAAIEPHEEAAEVALILMCVTGVLALGALLWRAKERALSGLTLLAGIATAASLGYTAKMGGPIHHPEITGEAPPVGASPDSKENPAKDAEDEE